MIDDTRDMVVRLETKVEHIERQLNDVQNTVNEMHDLLMQAKGLRSMIIVMAAVAGFVASFATKFLPLR